MFYWDDEREFFEENGGRKNRNILHKSDGSVSMVLVSAFVHSNELNQSSDVWLNSNGAKLRQAYYDRGQGTYPTTSGNAGSVGKTDVAKIKPYICSKHMTGSGTRQHFPCDKYRIFGKAISNAQPYEMLDIVLSRQSI